MADRSEPGLKSGFRPNPWVTLATLAMLAVLLGLGTWQLERREWKQGLLARIEQGLAAEPVALPPRIEDPLAWDYRRVRVTGVFRHDAEMPLSARVHEGRAGYHVVTPLDRPDGSTVLVDRGWIPVDRLDPATRPEGQPEGTVSVEGIARVPPPPGWMQPDNDPAANTWFWIDLPAMAGRLGEPVAPVVVEAGPAPNPGGLPVGGRTRVTLPDNHLQYALTWYSFAVILVVVYIASQCRRGSGRPKPVNEESETKP